VVQSAPLSQTITLPAIGSNAARKCCMDLRPTTVFCRGIDAEGLELLQIQHLRRLGHHQDLDAVDLDHGRVGPKECRKPPIIGPSPV
jgi:hypothetical protein